MIIDENLQKISSRYDAFLAGVQGVFGAAIYDSYPTSPKVRTELGSKLKSMLEGAKEEMRSMIEDAVRDSVALSFDIALEGNYDIDEQLMKWEELSELMTLQSDDLIRDISNQMSADAGTALKRFNQFRLKVAARNLSGEAQERHLIVSEREKALESFAIKFTDSTGRKYDSGHYASKRIAWTLRTLQRQTMYFVLMSMGETTGQVVGGSDDGKIVQLEDLFDAKPQIFHYGSNALLIKSVVTN